MPSLGLVLEWLPRKELNDFERTCGRKEGSSRFPAAALGEAVSILTHGYCFMRWAFGRQSGGKGFYSPIRRHLCRNPTSLQSHSQLRLCFNLFFVLF